MTITRKRKLVFALFGTLFGLIAGFFLIEILLRFAAPDWLLKEMKELNLARNVTSFGSDVGWSVETIDGRFVRFVPRTNFDVRYYEYNHSVHIDGFGGRVVGSDQKKSPLIPFLGDSFAFGLGVEDQQTFVSLLNSNSRYQFINLGVPGSALPNQLDQIRFRHKELHSPSVYVFTFFAGNDYSDICKYYGKINLGTGGAEKAPEPVIEWLDRNIYRNAFFAKSYLLQFIKRTLLRKYFYTQQRVKTVLPSSCGIAVKGKPPLTNSALMMMTGRKKCLHEIDSYVKLALDDLEEFSKRLNFAAIFIIIPDKLQVNPPLLKSKAAGWNLSVENLDTAIPSKVMEDQLRARGIPYFDVSSCLTEKDNLFYKIDDHLTPAGHREVAECLFASLESQITTLLAARK